MPTNAPAAKAPPGVPPPRNLTRVFRNRNFLRLYLAGAGSTSGRVIGGVAINWIVYTTTGSALDVAIVGIVNLAAVVLLSLPAGVWVDRYDRKRIMVFSDVVRAASVGGLSLVFFLRGFDLPLVLLVVFVSAGVSGLFNPAEQSILPSIVARDEIADANGVVQSSRSVISLVASSVAGALLLVSGAALSLFYNSLTYILSALLVFSVSLAPVVRKGGARGPSAPKSKMTREIVEGWRWLLSARGLFQLSISALFMNFFNTLFSTFMVIYVVAGLHQTNPLAYGLFLAVATMGGALGSLLVGRTAAVRYAGKVWVLGYGVSCGALLFVLGALHNVWYATPIMFVYELMLQFSGNTWLTTAQRVVPEEMRGRYFSLDGLLSYGVMPVSQLVGGLLITLHGVNLALEIGGVGLLLSGLFAMLGRDLWRLDGTVATPGPTATATPTPTPKA